MEFNLDELKMIRRGLCDLSNFYEDKAKKSADSAFWQSQADKCEDIIEKVSQEIMKIKYSK